jgi:hypothetical protein
MKHLPTQCGSAPEALLEAELEAFVFQRTLTKLGRIRCRAAFLRLEPTFDVSALVSNIFAQFYKDRATAIEPPFREIARGNLELSG